MPHLARDGRAQAPSTHGSAPARAPIDAGGCRNRRRRGRHAAARVRAAASAHPGQRPGHCGSRWRQRGHRPRRSFSPAAPRPCWPATSREGPSSPTCCSVASEGRRCSARPRGWPCMSTACAPTSPSATSSTGTVWRPARFPASTSWPAPTRCSASMRSAAPFRYGRGMASAHVVRVWRSRVGPSSATGLTARWAACASGLAGFVAGSFLDEAGWRDYSPSTLRRGFGKGSWRSGASAVDLALTVAQQRPAGQRHRARAVAGGKPQRRVHASRSHRQRSRRVHPPLRSSRDARAPPRNHGLPSSRAHRHAQWRCG